MLHKKTMWMERKKSCPYKKRFQTDFFEEATKRLDNAQESKDLVGIQVAKAMLDALKVQRE